MRIKSKKLVFPFLLLMITLTGFSQLSMQQMMDINMGETFKESKPKIKQMFSQKPKVRKSDFLGAYRIEYKDVPFSFYGNADYTFQYVKDTLVSVEVEFEFLASDIYNFKRLYNTLITDMINDKSKKLLKEYSDLNSEKTFKYIEAECKTNTPERDKDYKPIKIKFLGKNYWDIYINSYLTNKFLKMSVGIGERHNGSGYNSPGYNGCVIDLTLHVSTYDLINLKSQEDKFSRQYSEIPDEEMQVKLKYQNGVYFIPVNLNGILSMDFVLDLGASDVSISPDVFLVLYKAGTIKESDFIGSQTYQFGDGSIAKSNVFIMKSIQIGDKEIKDVRVSISNSVNSPLLLGQSALKKLSGYRIDNHQQLLIIE